ncbi:DUF3943 domain-containing protein [Cystobacter fuscus]
MGIRGCSTPWAMASSAARFTAVPATVASLRRRPSWPPSWPPRRGSTRWRRFHQRPSAVDLVWTPLAGALLGEGRYRLHRALVRGGGQSPGTARKVLFFVVDPLGEAERRLLGAGC